MFRSLLPFVLLCSLTGSALQQAALVPDADAVNPATSPHDWHTAAPTFTLAPAGPEARSGQIWVRKAPDGLIIAGHVDGPAPDFPTAASDLMAKDHVEIWLALEPHPAMPVLGWGNQFGDINLPKGEESCASDWQNGSKPDEEGIKECQAWVRRQKSYRAHLRRLFARQWQLAPKVGMESFASAAYAEIERMVAAGKPDSGLEVPKLLNPQGAPELKARVNVGQGYDFETLIPWNMFPPSPNLVVQDAVLMVEVFNAASAGKKMGAYSTTAPGRSYADFAAFSRIRLAHPREYQVSACRYPMVGADFFDELQKGLFFPGTRQLINDTFILDNFRGGYAYGPSGLSPGVRQMHFYEREIASGEFICGPALRYFAGGHATDLKITSQDVTNQVVIDQKDFAFTRLPDGHWLLRNGPHAFWSKYGSGQCGACPRTELVVCVMDKDRKISEVFRVDDIVGNEIDDMDMQISPDWNRINIYRHKGGAEDDVWEDEFFCRKDLSYQKCGTASSAPPQPRTITQDELGLTGR